jgi:uncharacterized protein
VKIDNIIWKEDIVRKLLLKHNVEQYEVEEVLTDKPRFNYVAKGYTSGENVYRVLGQTDSGRYLAVFFIYKSDRSALIISARDMSDSEKKVYGRK